MKRYLFSYSPILGDEHKRLDDDMIVFLIQQGASQIESRIPRTFEFNSDKNLVQWRDTFRSKNQDIHWHIAEIKYEGNEKQSMSFHSPVQRKEFDERYQKLLKD